MSKGAVEISGADRWDNAEALTGSRQVAVGSGKLFDCIVFNTGGSDIYVQLYDTASGASLTPGVSVPLQQIKVSADDSGFFSLPNGRRFKNGIYVQSSDTNSALGNASTVLLIDSAYRLGA